MRTPLICMLVIAIAIPPTTVFASGIDPGLMASFHTYFDDTNLTIYSAKAELTQRLSDRFGLGASLGVDAISGASPSSDIDASSADESSTRVYPSLRIIYEDRNNMGTVGGYYSFESDYTGRSVFADYTRLMNRQNTALGASLSQSFDRWKISRLDPDKREERSFSLFFSQDLSQKAHARLVWTGYHAEGFLANPYRFIDFGATRVFERLPGTRDGDAFALKVVTLLNDPTSLHVGYRYYIDDWSISSNTIDITVYRDISPRWTLGGRFRIYSQSEADFVKPISAIGSGDSEIGIDYRYTSFDSYTAGVEFLFKPRSGPAGMKGGLDVYTTSSNEHINYWFGQDRITAVTMSFGLEYDY